MNRAAYIMQVLKARLEYWKPRIMQTALLSELEFIPTKGGEFTVVARWKTQNDEGEYKTHFSRERALGRTLTSTRQRLIKDTCRFRDDIIREVLQHRGIS